MSIVSCKCCYLLQYAKSTLCFIELMMAVENVDSAEFIKIANVCWIKNLAKFSRPIFLKNFTLKWTKSWNGRPNVVNSVKSYN